MKLEGVAGGLDPLARKSIGILRKILVGVPLNYKAVKIGPLWACQLNAIKWRFAGGDMMARIK